MKPIIPVLALASSILSVAALAAEPAAAPAASTDTLFKKNACVACHSPTTKLVGPAYKDVAAKYRDNKAAEQILFDKVKKGGSGVWGAVPMPPNAAVPDADLHAMIKSILATK
jgi:cytochrome c